MNLCVYEVIVLPKVVDFDFGWISSTSKLKLMIVVCMGAFRLGDNKNQDASA